MIIEEGREGVVRVHYLCVLDGWMYVRMYYVL